MAKQKPFITEEQWIKLEPWRPKPTPSAKDGQSPEATGKCLKALSGYCGVVHDGTIYLIDIHQLAFAGQDYSNGKNKVFGSKYGLSSFQNWTNRAS